MPTRDAEALSARALALIERTEAGTRPVRLLGVSVHNLADSPTAPPVAVDEEGRLPFGDPD